MNPFTSLQERLRRKQLTASTPTGELYNVGRVGASARALFTPHESLKIVCLIFQQNNKLVLALLSRDDHVSKRLTAAGEKLRHEYDPLVG